MIGKNKWADSEHCDPLADIKAAITEVRKCTGFNKAYFDFRIYRNLWTQQNFGVDFDILDREIAAYIKIYPKSTIGEFMDFWRQREKNEK